MINIILQQLSSGSGKQCISGVEDIIEPGEDWSGEPNWSLIYNSRNPEFKRKYTKKDYAVGGNSSVKKISQRLRSSKSINKAHF